MLEPQSEAWPVDALHALPGLHASQAAVQERSAVPAQRGSQAQDGMHGPLAPGLRVSPVRDAIPVRAVPPWPDAIPLRAESPEPDAFQAATRAWGAPQFRDAPLSLDASPDAIRALCAQWPDATLLRAEWPEQDAFRAAIRACGAPQFRAG